MRRARDWRRARFPGSLAAEMRRLRERPARCSAVLALAAGAALTVALSASPPIVANAQVAPALADLNGAQGLRNRFNDDRGHVRLVLLLSPT